MKENYGIADYIFGLDVTDEDELIDMVHSNVNDYVEGFKERYSDDL
jgi:hypothetical protein